jgi:multidrug resistance efflux pump
MEESLVDEKLKNLNQQLEKLKSTNRFESLELDAESNENLLKIKFIYDKQLNEIERQYEAETNKAIKDYNDKRTELKETLKMEHEEMRKKCAEISDLNIHYDETLIFSSNAKHGIISFE